MLSRSLVLASCKAVAASVPRRHGSSIPVILVNGAQNMGVVGEEVLVKRGYARNFLIPRKVAVYATEANRIKFRRSEVAAAPSSGVVSTESVAALKALGTLQISKPTAESGSLYAAVTAADIKDILDKSHNLHVKTVDFSSSIKSTGSFVVVVDGVEVKVEVNSA